MFFVIKTIINYSFIFVDCGSTIDVSTSETTVTSPGYPKSVTGPIACIYVFNIPRNDEQNDEQASSIYYKLSVQGTSKIRSGIYTVFWWKVGDPESHN